ncbi:serine-threonine protein kinase 19-domain-containing protein [Aspergillus caelatus]|uniref:Serine-threonine protein kinase 19-domain-containing protein n=2 Tax=Aspergillus subgen. Circumdati TaxID=2720871 RepID=A0A5N7A6P0_9EURO|nr:serine-threonine protein kinase 19-domain-containing protein [Aspergillus caelatus]KAE8364200.1 serine-threonine protein kinase 19-domain-containing protein [Aspergillus caelatus]KAE8417765.1 serine-threonine protein kinase 19-domain-containing protein [Aspergillus pseudocaelatus]
MPLRITSAPVSGVKKRRKPSNTALRSSPFASHARRRAIAQSFTDVKSNDPSGEFREEYGPGPLPDIGMSRYIPETTPVEDVIQAICHIRDSFFEDLPTRTGMNSTRVAELLNLRRSLPPLASVAHVHTLLDIPTKVEREIVDSVNSGRIRRLIVPGRGNDAAGLGDCLVLSEDWERLVRDSSIGSHLKDKFLDVLSRPDVTFAVPDTLFSAPECMALVRAGFLVSSSSSVKGSPGIISLPTFPPTSSSGNSASRGDPAALDDKEGGSRSRCHTTVLFLSLPNTGPYLRLLSSGRAHLLALIRKSNSSEVPLHLLRDRWDGAVETDKSFSAAKRIRGEHAGILPGRTKKWKELCGMNFRWVLEEALGAGLIEIFDTGSVGPGVRCL